jgi:hypothetical protein
VHRIELRAAGGRLVGRSEPTETGTLELDLSTDGLLVTGGWTERTSPSGYYRGAVYHGIVQFVLDPTGRSMIGRRLGPDRHFEIDSGPGSSTAPGERAKIRASVTRSEIRRIGCPWLRPEAAAYS